MIENIKTGDRVEIAFERDTSHQKTYVSMVEHVINKQQLMLHMPVSYGKIIKLPLVENYVITVYTDGGMILFNARIESYTKEEQFNVMIMNLTSGGEKKQRRGFFRFDCLLPIQFTYLNEDGVESSAVQGIAKDISGGGIRFVSNEDVPDKVNFKVVIMLNDDFLITVGKILVKQTFPKSNYRFQYKAQFTNMNAEEQEKIVKYIFDEQRKMMQRRRV